jgi:hypothetical protein
MSDVPKRRWLIYAASFVFPFFGLAYGMVEITKPEEEARRRGKTCIILGLAAAVLICVGALAYLAYQIKQGLGAVGGIGG